MTEASNACTMVTRMSKGAMRTESAHQPGHSLYSGAGMAETAQPTRMFCPFGALGVRFLPFSQGS